MLTAQIYSINSHFSSSYFLFFLAQKGTMGIVVMRTNGITLIRNAYTISSSFTR